MPRLLCNIDYESRYSADRVELAQEIRDVLTSRGYKVSPDWASDDLVMAVAIALDVGKRAIKAIEADWQRKSAP